MSAAPRLAEVRTEGNTPRCRDTLRAAAAIVDHSYTPVRRGGTRISLTADNGLKAECVYRREGDVTRVARSASWNALGPLAAEAGLLDQLYHDLGVGHGLAPSTQTQRR
jgi:hypothetical protein